MIGKTFTPSQGLREAIKNGDTPAVKNLLAKVSDSFLRCILCTGCFNKVVFSYLETGSGCKLL